LSRPRVLRDRTRGPDAGTGETTDHPKRESCSIIQGGTMLTDTKAATMAEYAVIAAVVIAVAVGLFSTLGGKIVSSLNKLTGGEGNTGAWE
jgi:pilus assembly protein Flp/PilA